MGADPVLNPMKRQGFMGRAAAVGTDWNRGRAVEAAPLAFRAGTEKACPIVKKAVKVNDCPEVVNTARQPLFHIIML